MLLEQHGDDGLRVADVAADAGTSVGAIYTHFRDREALVAVARANQIRGRVAEDAAALREALDSGLGGEDLVAALMAVAIRPDDDERRRVRWSRIAGLAAARHHPLVAAEAGRSQHQLNELMIETVRRAKELGVVRADVDERSVALLVQAVPLGFVLADLDPETAPSAEAWLDLVARLGEALAPPAGDAPPA